MDREPAEKPKLAARRGGGRPGGRPDATLWDASAAPQQRLGPGHRDPGPDSAGTLIHGTLSHLGEWHSDSGTAHNQGNLRPALTEPGIPPCKAAFRPLETSVQGTRARALQLCTPARPASSHLGGSRAHSAACRQGFVSLVLGPAPPASAGSAELTWVWPESPVEWRPPVDPEPGPVQFRRSVVSF